MTRAEFIRKMQDEIRGEGQKTDPGVHSENFYAVRWFPDRTDIPGVSGTNPNKLCGCVLIGGPASEPHVHGRPLNVVWKLEPGVWILRQSDGSRIVVSDADFQKHYEKVANPDEALLVSPEKQTYFEGFSV